MIITPFIITPPAPTTTLQDYFREVTRQDVSNLLSFIIDPDDDDALLVPQLGRSGREPLPALARPHPPAALVGGKGQQMQGQAGAEDDEAAEVGFRAPGWMRGGAPCWTQGFWS